MERALQTAITPTVNLVNFGLQMVKNGTEVLTTNGWPYIATHSTQCLKKTVPVLFFE